MSVDHLTATGQAECAAYVAASAASVAAAAYFARQAFVVLDRGPAFASPNRLDPFWPSFLLVCALALAAMFLWMARLATSPVIRGSWADQDAELRRAARRHCVMIGPDALACTQEEAVQRSKDRAAYPWMVRFAQQDGAGTDRPVWSFHHARRFLRDVTGLPRSMCGLYLKVEFAPWSEASRKERCVPRWRDTDWSVMASWWLVTTLPAHFGCHLPTWVRRMLLLSLKVFVAAPVLVAVAAILWRLPTWVTELLAAAALAGWVAAWNAERRERRTWRRR